MSSDLLSFIFIVILVLIGVFLIFTQDRFTWTLHRRHPEVWEAAGAPGGFMWRPNGRGFWENIMITCTFWANNQFGLDGQMTFPDDIKKLYGIYFRVNTAMFIVFFVFILSLFGMYLYEGGAVGANEYSGSP